MIGIPDIRYPMLNGARYEPGFAIFGDFFLPGCIKLPIPAHDFFKKPQNAVIFPK
jgi:hypothetical protein